MVFAAVKLLLVDRLLLLKLLLASHDGLLLAERRLLLLSILAIPALLTLLAVLPWLLSERRRISKHRLAVDVLRERLRTRETPVRVQEDQAKIFSRDRILVLFAQKTQLIGLDELIDAGRIHSKSPLIFLNRARVFLTAKNQF